MMQTKTGVRVSRLETWWQHCLHVSWNHFSGWFWQSFNVCLVVMGNFGNPVYCVALMVQVSTLCVGTLLPDGNTLELKKVHASENSQCTFSFVHTSKIGRQDTPDVSLFGLFAWQAWHFAPFDSSAMAPKKRPAAADNGAVKRARGQQVAQKYHETIWNVINHSCPWNSFMCY